MIRLRGRKRIASHRFALVSGYAILMDTASCRVCYFSVSVSSNIYFFIVVVTYVVVVTDMTGLFSFAGIDFKIRTVELDGKKIKLQIWFVLFTSQSLCVLYNCYAAAGFFCDIYSYIFYLSRYCPWAIYKYIYTVLENSSQTRARNRLRWVPLRGLRSVFDCGDLDSLID